MRVCGLWRYPVKGLRGEALAELSLDQRGVVGDRWWAVVGADGKLGSGKTTRRFRRMPNLFTMSARTDSDGTVLVTVADWEGAVHEPEAARRVSEAVGETVTLRPEASVRHHDEGGLHLVTTASLRYVDGIDVRRLRPNVLLDVDGDAPVEDGWIGREIELGDTVIVISRPMPRCVMTTLAQSDLEFAPSLLSAINERNGGHLGVVADVTKPGVIRRPDNP